MCYIFVSYIFVSYIFVIYICINMNTPFIFGKIADDKNFTDRQDEIKKLITNFSSLINTIIISPRRWGKSSLVKKASKQALHKEKNLCFCFIDMYNIRTEEEFYQQLAEEAIKAGPTKLNDIIDDVKTFITRLIPKLSFSPGPESEISLSLNWKEVKHHPDEILDLAEKIAIRRNLKIIICVDEFQNISGFEKPLDFQKKLRPHWQKHQHVGYCLYGSKRHMLMEFFNSPSMPLYKFGDLMPLEKIEKKHWESFIQKRFKETGKNIDRKNAGLISKLCENHPYYVQQVAQLAWLQTNKTCTTEDVKKSHENLVLQLSMLFQTLTDSLSNTQLNFLKATSFNEKQLSSQQTLNKYNLGTSANVIRIKQTLTKKEIIEARGSQINILDPIYKYWLKEYYFKVR